MGLGMGLDQPERDWFFFVTSPSLALTPRSAASASAVAEAPLGAATVADAGSARIISRGGDRGKNSVHNKEHNQNLHFGWSN